jgi:glycosyltransferase involved in cell wall biosynthesis
VSGNVSIAVARSAREIVAGLLQRREYQAALVEAIALPVTHPDRDALVRVSYARMGRFEPAAEAGRRHLARPGATLEDYYRQAQILLRCGYVNEAFEAGLTALKAAPEDWRLLTPIVEAVLAEPALERRLRSEAEPIIRRHPRVPLPPWSPGHGVLITNHLPHYGPIIGDHPIYRRFCDQLAPIPRYRPPGYGTGVLAAILEALPRSFHALDRLMAAGLDVSRAAVARYVGSRTPSLLVDGGGCAIEFAQIGMTLGERPYFITFDFMPVLFYPFSPAEQMNFPEEEGEVYRIIRHELSSAACLGLINHCREAGDLLGRVFDNPAIARKSHYVNLPSSIESVQADAIKMPQRGNSPEITILFASSFSQFEDNFYMRGGVDVLNAFMELHGEFSHLRLKVCGKLPASLSVRLREAIESHPAIEWHPNFLSQIEYENILAESDIFAIPSIATFRNGLVQALSRGLVPVVSDCHYAAEIVPDLVKGLVVTGRRRWADVAPTGSGFRSDWCPLYRSVDQPSDPVFFEDFKQALRRLVTDRPLLRSLSQRNLDEGSSHEWSATDTERLRHLVGNALREVTG